MKRTFIALAAVGMLALPACGGSDEGTGGEPTGGGGAGIANPASVFCEQQGGTVELVDEAGGQVGYCVLPDGQRIEEWAYYRSMNPEPSSSGESQEQEDEEQSG